MDETMKLPFVHQNVVDYLKESFDVSAVLYASRNLGTKEAYGYIQGTQAVINQLAAIVAQQEGIR